MKIITPRKLKELISEEKSASKMYKNYGFRSIARQEASHAKKLQAVLVRRKQ